MGDRVSISFIKDTEESLALFSHWGGMAFVDTARDYVKKLNKEVPEESMYPLTRREPRVVMVDFIRSLFENSPKERVRSNYYLGKDENDGDNSDNGHHKIKL
jgi:hypothetical protein